VICSIPYPHGSRVHYQVRVPQGNLGNVAYLKFEIHRRENTCLFCR
jgi:hypothetical protein